jgi:hypothetical protein
LIEGHIFSRDWTPLSTEEIKKWMGKALNAQSAPVSQITLPLLKDELAALGAKGATFEPSLVNCPTINPNLTLKNLNEVKTWLDEHPKIEIPESELIALWGMAREMETYDLMRLHDQIGDVAKQVGRAFGMKAQ